MTEKRERESERERELRCAKREHCARSEKTRSIGVTSSMEARQRQGEGKMRQMSPRRVEMAGFNWQTMHAVS